MVTPIETHYHGYRFRSRLEARWAVFFDALGVTYRYEPEGFKLDGIGYYLPDFYLPEARSWIEIKPETPSRIEKLKAKTLAEQSCQDVTILYGSISAPLVEQVYKTIFITQSTYSGIRFFGNFRDLEEYDYFLMGYETLPDYLITCGVDPDIVMCYENMGDIETARHHRNLDYQLHKNDPNQRKYEHLQHGVHLDKLAWCYRRNDSSGDYLLRRCDQEWDFLGGLLTNAYHAAQTARFEHGETPEIR